tara:strand:- start:174 stop:350 length:177 start_codon:yes stop_codon:yes gene_type:complete
MHERQIKWLKRLKYSAMIQFLMMSGLNIIAANAAAMILLCMKQLLGLTNVRFAQSVDQ